MMDKLISQKKILEEFRSLCGPATGDGWDNFGIRDLIMRQPVVDAVPVVHGRWKEQYMYYACSVCGAEYNDEIVLLYEGDNNNGLFSGFEYCPHCGAKMDGSDSNGNRQ